MSRFDRIRFDISALRDAGRRTANPARLIVGIAVALAGSSTALASPYDTLESIAGSYNMFLLGDLGTAGSPYTADMQGAVAVAGNAYMNGVTVDTFGTGPAGLVVGGNLSQTGGDDSGNVYVGGNASIAYAGSTNNLSVGGNLTTQGGTFTGNVFVGGSSANLSGGTTVNGSLNMTGAGSTLNAGGAASPSAIFVTASTTVNDPSYWTAPTVGGGPATPTAPVDLYGSASDIKNASTALAASGTTTITSNGGNIVITLTQNGLNVINLNLPNGATINGITIVDANGVTPTGLVVNVNGDNLNFNGGTYNLGGLSTSQVLFNFSSATALTLSSLAFEGTLLAPLATVDFVSGQINGDLIADNYLGSGQINAGGGLATPLGTYNDPNGDNTVATTPEPASVMVFGSGLVAVALLRQRGRRVLPRLR